MLNQKSRNREDEGRLTPPNDLDAEKSVLGSMMQEDKALALGMELHESSHFYKTAHGFVFEAMHDLFMKDKKVDIITLAAKLSDKGMLDEVGGNYYLTELIASVPSAENIRHHSEVVIQKFMLRQLGGIGMEITSMSQDIMKMPAEIIEVAEDKIFKLALRGNSKGFVSFKETSGIFVGDILSYVSNGKKCIGIETGFHKLTDILGGFQKSDLIIVAGRTSMGKTSFALKLASNMSIDQNISGAIFNLEMTNRQCVGRIISARARIDYHKLRNMRLEPYEMSKMVEVERKIREAPFYMDDTPALTITELRARAKRLKAVRDIDYMIVDYLQLLRAPNIRDGREKEVSYISQNLKAIAKELDIPLIALAQLSRAVENRRGDKRPQLSDLRESGAIEQDADVVIFSYRPAYYNIIPDDDYQKAEQIIAKQRNGPTGIVEMQFQKRYVTFEEIDERYDDSDFKSRQFKDDDNGLEGNGAYEPKQQYLDVSDKPKELPF